VVWEDMAISPLDSKVNLPTLEAKPYSSLPKPFGRAVDPRCLRDCVSMPESSENPRVNGAILHTNRTLDTKIAIDANRITRTYAQI